MTRASNLARTIAQLLFPVLAFTHEWYYMTRYVAFLRGVNVGTHNRLSTSALCRRLAASGFRDVSGYKQSGNVIFDTHEGDTGVIGKRIREELHGLIGKDVDVFLRTMQQVKDIVDLDPFKEARSGDDTGEFITFLEKDIPVKPVLPIESPRKDVEVICIRGPDVFCRVRKNNGRSGDPNGFIESKFKVSATTQNWATIKGIALLPGPLGRLDKKEK